MKRDNNTPRRVLSAFSVLLIMSALSVIGIALLPRLNIQYSPSPVERNITVSFSWNNASARLIEQQITSRIEAALSVIGGCDDISSRSSKGGGSVTVKFRKGTDMTAARFEVASVIRNIYSKLPEEVSYPNISLATGGSREKDILTYTIKAGIPSEQIYDYVVNKVSTPLSRIEGVGRVNISGTTPFEWIVEFNPEALESVGLTADHLATAFRDYFRSDIVGMTTLSAEDGVERSIVLRLQNLSTLDFDNIPIVRHNDRLLRCAGVRRCLLAIFV